MNKQGQAMQAETDAKTVTAFSKKNNEYDEYSEDSCRMGSSGEGNSY